MEIRSANDSDIPSIVELLKLSLGESLMPKSEAYWRWKHVDNPFGKSPVLIAIQDEKLIGVRAFMRWEWTDGERIYKSVRAVDTATHPDHQGKGIFKKLTLQLLDQCRDEGVSFIFNTPNSQSRPGYLKMGWQVAGRVSIKFNIPHLFASNLTELNVPTLNFDTLNIYKDNTFSDGVLRTNRTISYLKWRYSSVPVVNYYYSTDTEKKQLLIFRIKKNKWGTELRITDEIGSMGNNLIKSRWITTRAVTRRSNRGLILPIGPIVTVNPLHYPINNLRNFKKWETSLGDLELF